MIDPQTIRVPTPSRLPAASSFSTLTLVWADAGYTGGSWTAATWQLSNRLTRLTQFADAL